MRIPNICVTILVIVGMPVSAQEYGRPGRERAEQDRRRVTEQGERARVEATRRTNDAARDTAQRQEAQQQAQQRAAELRRAAEQQTARDAARQMNSAGVVQSQGTGSGVNRSTTTTAGGTAKARTPGH